MSCRGDMGQSEEVHTELVQVWLEEVQAALSIESIQQSERKY